MDYPKFGTAFIRCGRTRCSWRGLEADLKKVPGTMGDVRCVTSTCPTCGCDSYSFMSLREINSWKRKQSAAIAAKER